jgi:hypothetical protein
MQYQDQHDNEYEAEPAATIVAGPVEGAASNPLKPPSKHNAQNNEQDSADRHSIISLVAVHAWGQRGPRGSCLMRIPFSSGYHA